MKRRSVRHAAREAGVRRHLYIVRLSKSAEAHRRRKAADARDLRLHHVERSPLEELAEAEEAELGLAGGDGDGLRTADEGGTVDVVRVNRVFDAPQVMLRHLVAAADRGRAIA